MDDRLTMTDAAGLRVAVMGAVGAAAVQMPSKHIAGIAGTAFNFPRDPALLIKERLASLLEHRERLLEARIGLASQLAKVDQDLSDCQAAARVFGVVIEVPPLPTNTQPPRIAGFVLGMLESGGPKGTKAAEIRERYQTDSGRAIHEKTIGMTLYRLMKAGKVRRDGRLWFLA